MLFYAPRVVILVSFRQGLATPGKALLQSIQFRISSIGCDMSRDATTHHTIGVSLPYSKCYFIQQLESLIYCMLFIATCIY